MTPRARRERGGDDPRSWPVRSAVSYGGVVVRTTDAGTEVALIRPRDDKAPKKEVWALPKGAKDDDEEPAEAALREVREETGLDAVIVWELEPITYWFSWPAERVRYRKTVHFFLMRHTGGNATPDGYEVADVRFFPIADAIKKASYASERKVLQRAAEIPLDEIADASGDASR